MPYENAEYVRTLLEIEIEVLETSRRQSFGPIFSIQDDSSLRLYFFRFFFMASGF